MHVELAIYWMIRLTLIMKLYPHLQYYEQLTMLSHSWLSLLLQVVAGSVASYAVGMVWFSGLCFGRQWWKYTFQNQKDGQFLVTE